MFNLDTIALDLELEVEGRWVPYPHPITGEPSGMEFRIARFPNPRYHEMLAKITAGSPRDEKGELAKEEWERVTTVCVARTVLVGWRGRIADDGSVVEYSPEASEALLSDPRFQHVRRWVSARASEFGQYLAGAIAKDAETLGNGSGGSSSTPSSSRTRRSRSG